MTKQKFIAGMFAVLFVSSGLDAQIMHAGPVPEKPADSSSVRAAYFIDPQLLDIDSILASPPAQDSETTSNELAELSRIEKLRTPQQVAAAQADDQEQDIFIFRNALGRDFTADKLPLTASFSAHIQGDEDVASRPLKILFARPRPFQFDHTLHPVCALSKEKNSYPSGHALSGYLLALTLVQIVPEKKAEIMERAHDYAHNRLVCGVHYASDIEASREIAYVMFGYMLANPRFQKDLEAAREETRARLGMPLTAPR